MPVGCSQLQLACECLDSAENQAVDNFNSTIRPWTVGGGKVVVGTSSLAKLVDDFVLEMRAADGDPGMDIPKGRKPVEEAIGKRSGVACLAWP